MHTRGEQLWETSLFFFPTKPFQVGRKKGKGREKKKHRKANGSGKIKDNAFPESGGG